MAVLARGCTRSLELRGQLENSGADASFPLALIHPVLTFSYRLAITVTRSHGPRGTPTTDCNAQMAEMGSLAGSADHNHHSTLEVVPAQDSSKLAFNKNDKVAFVPSHEHDKIAVPPQPYDDASHYQQADAGHWRPQSTPTQDGYTWDGDASDPWAAGEGVGTEKKERILGLKRWVFFAVLGIAALLVAIGVGVGVGVGVSTRPTSNAEADAAASSTSDAGIPATTSGQSATATSRSPTSSAPQSTPSRQVGGVGGRCSENWGSDCICLDETVCSTAWNGTAQTGRKPDWPCPNDPASIKACYVQPCKNAAQLSSRCLWREDCAELDPGKRCLDILAPALDIRCSYMDETLTCKSYE
ncbi:predicted protein [Chaetomium globosum CBS 148.51]|uniref:Uncharacterized protein n=1 Tax=Chaetomium globosum (strain ATCC 6205 / CBS 148.51 / DSM 1962 / NBRC 6347 / NRRL 1970) TaxID=306901 RepID=Q2HCM3_CHAGB|nr:uncharacterized protein CHGG_02031 [Chaetomium globosum CBS 148.51]EAQ93796.1 predicted protein [Chaetomium globosum CBS 148.51]